MNPSESQSKEIAIHIFVKSYHAKDKMSCRLRSGFLIYVNTALIFSEQLSTVDTSVFDDEFITMKEGTDVLRGLRY